MNKKITIGVIVALIVVGIAVYALRPTTQQKVGGLANNSQSSNFTAIGLGIGDTYAVTTGDAVFMAPQQVTCSIQSPAATSSLTFASVDLQTTAVSTTTTWVLSWATTATATTTSIATIGTAKTASTMFDYAVSPVTTYIPPSAYVNVWVLASSSAQYANLSGNCTAEFHVL